MAKIDEFDFVIIGKTPAAIMISINLSFHGYRICILNVSNMNNYPPYLSVPLSAFDIMNIPYNDFESINLQNSSNNYVERIFKISRIKHLFDNDSSSEQTNFDVNTKVFFDNRRIISISTENFVDYLVTIGKSKDIVVKDCVNYEVIFQDVISIVNFKPISDEKESIKCKYPILNSIGSEKSGVYSHQQIIVPKLLTDGLDVFYDPKKNYHSYIFVFPSKNNTVVNLIGKKNSKINLIEFLNDFLLENYNYEHSEPITNTYEYKSDFIDSNLSLFENNTILVGSALSLTHPLSYGYFSAEIQSSLILADVLLELIDNKTEFNTNMVVRDFKMKLIDLPFFKEINFIAGKEFYELEANEIKSLVNILNLRDLSRLSLVNRFMTNVSLFFNNILRRKRNNILSIYKGYKISRKWF
ncbi:MAG: hypothetical protein ACW981_08785 [Candidatus Hodarchaeales archaeon]